MSSKRWIHTTGEHNIDNIVRSEYGDLPPEQHAEKKKVLASLNPHITSLESLRVGDQVYLEDRENETSEEPVSQEERPEPESSELVPDSIDLSDIPVGTPVDETVHTPAMSKGKKKHASESDEHR